MRRCFIMLALLSVVGLTSKAESIKTPANLIVNGSFEEGVEVVPDNPGFLSINEGGEGIKGWTVTRGQIDYIQGYWKAADGKRSLDMNGSPGVGGVKQTIKTVKGKKYQLTFKLAGNPGAPVIKELTVEVAGEKKAFAFDTTDKTREEMGWQAKELTFTATSDKTDIELYTTTKDTENSGPALDDVAVVEVK